ncbi:MAG: hypothetical protein QOD66_58 [Solirubrobacteraceae bacterium]|jgi:hypothetical protein|nr:hypothetical protein [Solirubrobacteraceae bacterium]
MSRLRHLIVLACALCACAGTLATPAFAAQSQVVADCNAHSRLTGHYSSAQLRNALSTMSADVKEYTNCYDVIQRTLLKQLGASGASGSPGQGSGGSFLPTPVIIVLVVLVLGAIGFALAAVRRRNAGNGPDGPAGGPPSAA